jgi:hypothetical protein
MTSSAIARRLTQPPFEADSFTATEFSSATDKAAFANDLVRFLAKDCPDTGFTKKLYHRLSLCFGHIAHYNRDGFYGRFFADTGGRLEFLHQMLDWPAYGSPDYTYCDVERAVAARVRASGLLLELQSRCIDEVENAERAALARLKAKYEPQPHHSPQSTVRDDLFDFVQKG